MARYKIVNGENIEMSSEEEAQYDALETQMAEEYAKVEYIVQRLGAYKKLADQVDMLYRDIDNDTLDKTGEFYLHINGVKTEYEKPVEE